MKSRIPRLLIVDDEMNICQSCIKILSRSDYHVDFALNGYDAIKLVKKNNYDLIITDLKMSSLGGMEVLRQAKELFPEIIVIIMTGYASVSSAVEVMKTGAFDYLPKPFTPHELREVVQQALDKKNLTQPKKSPNRSEKPEGVFPHQLIGKSPKIQAVIQTVKKVAPTDATVLIQGESGTGKELISRAIHANSKRNNRVFFALDCGTLSGNLLESELFGYEKGAFTGADKQKQGIFKLAHQGTVFLDEISNINIDVQIKLLRFLETQEFIPLGSSRVHKVNVRLIMASNRNLQEMVKLRTFREDFYYRIFVYPIYLPSLRDIKSDILDIANHFLKFYAKKIDKSILGFKKEAAKGIQMFHWPGNVRQLRNSIERAVILCESDWITLDDVPLIKELDMVGNETDSEMGTIPSTNEELKKIKKAIKHQSVLKIERKFLVKALSENKWNVTKAADKVGLQRTNFQKLMKKHKISLQHLQENSDDKVKC